MSSPQQYRCPRCFQVIFTGSNLSGSLKIPCPNRQCPSRQTKPLHQHKFDFSGKK